MGDERRQYIRHPSSIPLVYECVEGETRKKHLRDISVGGVSFRTDHSIEHGTVISVRIDLISPPFKGKGEVVWCRERGHHYDVGIRFLDENTGFRARMVEQVCYIEQYKRKIAEEEGRELSGEDAACEWISKYAQDFPG